MNPNAWNDYITNKVDNEINKRLQNLNSSLQGTIITQIDDILRLYQTPGTQFNKSFVNKFFSIITSTLVNDLNGKVGEHDRSNFREILETYVDERLIILTNDADAVNNVGSIISKLTNEIALLLSNSKSFNIYGEQLLIEYYNTRSSLKSSLDNKIKDLIDNNEQIQLLIMDNVNRRLDVELTPNVERKLLNIISELSRQIIPRLLETIIQIKVTVSDIEILEMMINDLHGDIVDFDRLYAVLSCNIEGHHIQYNGFIPLNSGNILLGAVINVVEPLDPFIKYVFLLDLILKNQDNNKYGELAYRFLSLTKEITDVFSPIPNDLNSIRNPINNRNIQKNIISQITFHNIQTKLWDFIRYVSLQNTTTVLNRKYRNNNNHIHDNNENKYNGHRFTADDDTIDFLFSVIKINLEKIKLNMIEASLYASFTSDKLLDNEFRRFRNIVPLMQNK